MFVLVATSCQQDTPQPSSTPNEIIDESAGYRATILYFQSDDGLMVPVMKQIPWEEGIGRAALEQMMDTDNNRIAASAMGLKNVLPKDISFSLSINDNALATVNIIDFYELQNADEEQNMITAIVNTLTEFPTIENVQFLFDGKKRESLGNGTKVNQPMGKIPLNVQAAQTMQNAQVQIYPLTLYYPNRSASLNIPVTRYLTENPTLFTAISELLKGPDDAALLSCFPENTTLLDAVIANNTAIINFSSEFAQLSDHPELEQAMLETLELTAQEFENVSSVSILIDGSEYSPASTATITIPLYANTFK